MDSTETASSSLVLPSTGSSSSPPFDYNSVDSSIVAKTNVLNNDNTDSNGESSKIGIGKGGGVESGLEEFKEVNGGDPCVVSVNDDEKVSKVGVFEGGEIGETGNNGSVGRIEVNESVDDVGEVGAMEAGEVVEGGNRTEHEKGIREENSGDPFAGSVDNSFVGNEPRNNDVDKVIKDGVLEGGEIVEGGNNGSVDKIELDSVDLKVTGVDGGASEAVVPLGAENSASNDVEERDGEVVEVMKNSKGGEGEKDSMLDNGGRDSMTEGKEVEETEMKGEEPVEGCIDEAVGTTKEDKMNSEEAGPAEVELAVAEGLKFTSQGDSVVEAIEVELSNSGEVVVGEAKDSENVQSEEVEAPSNESEALVNVTDVTNQLTKQVEREIEVDAPRISEAAADENVVPSEPKETKQKTDAPMASDQNIGEEPAVTNNKASENPEKEIEQEAASHTKENGTVEGISADGEVKSVDQVSTVLNIDDQDVKLAIETSQLNAALNDGEVENKKSRVCQQEDIPGGEDDGENEIDEDGELDGLISDEDTEGMIFGSSEAAKHFIEELERGSGGGSHSGAESPHDNSQRIDGQIVTDSDEEGETDEEGDGRELFDSAALAALLKAATGADTDGGNITIRSQDGSRIFSVERPAGLGSSLRSLRPAPQPSRPLFPPTTLSSNADSDNNLSDEEKKKLQKLQDIRVKYLRILQRLGVSSEESIVNQVLYRLQVVAGRQSNQLFNMDAAKQMAMQLEAEGKNDLDFSINILVLGKCGVGKSAIINSIFGQEKATINAFEPGTSNVTEISGFVDGVKIRVFDTPGLKPSDMEQPFNRSVLSSVKKLTKKTPPDIILYVDRLDAPTRDLNDLPTLRTITSSLGPSIWRSAIITLTHAASAPPDGPSGSPLSYEAFITQRSHVIQHCIGQAVGDLRMMSASSMNPVSLVENHPSCRKNREGQKVLPNGQIWRPQLLLLCYSMKILSEASALSKPQDLFDHRKLFGFRARSPPLPYMLSSMLQSRPHPKLSSEQGGDNGDSDIDLDDYSDSDQEEEDEYDQLPPFKPLKKAQLARLSREQRNAYFEEYDYRVKLLQKKQWREELRRMREMKTTGKGAAVDYGDTEEDAAAPIAVPLPDMALPPSFDSDYPAYRYRFLEPTSQFLARPVLDTHGWDHDCGYDGVNLEHALAIASRFPASYTIQISKDKKDFTINLDSSISAKHGENGSTMAGFDIQSIGKQLAYIVRGETKFKNLKKNKTAGGISVTFLGENVVPGIKLEDQVTLGKQYALTGSAGAVRSQHDTAYGANFELQRREQDYPIGQVQSTFSMSIIKWRGDLALGFNCLSQFSIGRNSKVAVRAGINNKLSGQISVKTSSSDHLSLALTAIIPTAIAIYRKLQPDVGEKYSIY